MLIIQEKPLQHFEQVKEYFSDSLNVHRISNKDFKVDENLVDSLLSAFPDGRPNIYGLFIKKPHEAEWHLKYIGQRQSKGIKQRLREHFFYCNPKTGSQLKNVKAALANGYEIGLKMVRITPDINGQEHFRLLYESMLIEVFKEKLEWNKQK